MRQTEVVEDATDGGAKRLETDTMVAVVILYVAELRRLVNRWRDHEPERVLVGYTEHEHLCSSTLCGTLLHIAEEQP